MHQLGRDQKTTWLKYIMKLIEFGSIDSFYKKKYTKKYWKNYDKI